MSLFEWCLIDFRKNSLKLILFVIIVLYIFMKLSVWLWKRRRLYLLSMKLDGPLSFPIIGSLPQLLKLARRKDPINVMCNFILNPGGVTKFWLGPDLIIFLSKPEDVEVVFKSKSISAKPPRFFQFASKMLGAGILTTDGLDARWKVHRRIMAPAFNTAALRSYHPFLQRHTEIFLEDLQQFVGKEHVDYHIVIGRFVADTVSESMLDFKSNFRDGHDDEVIHALDRMTDVSFKKLYMIWYLIDFLYKRSKLRKIQVRATNAMTHYAKTVYEAKMKEFGKDKNDTRPSVLQYLLDQHVEGELEEEEVLDEIKTIWVAGVDTMIGDSCLLLMMLAMHKDVQDKIFQEIREYYKDNKNAPVENNDLNHFPHLDMCVKEVLRLFPVAPINFRYVTEELEIRHRGLTIPPNTTIGMVLLASHRDPDVWENPHDFIPERFSPENSSSRHQFAYYPFSGGNRNCIGQRYGFNFLKTFTVYLLRKYELHSNIDFKTLGFYYDVNIKPKTGFKAKFTHREW